MSALLPIAVVGAMAAAVVMVARQPSSVVSLGPYAELRPLVHAVYAQGCEMGSVNRMQAWSKLCWKHATY